MHAAIVWLRTPDLAIRFLNAFSFRAPSDSCLRRIGQSRMTSFRLAGLGVAGNKLLESGEKRTQAQPGAVSCVLF
jgi:hypothetical protein